jgi:glycine cleavage system aminomethyltransferase T
MHTEQRPAQAGVAFAVKLGKGSFRGREALNSASASAFVSSSASGTEPSRRLCCLRLSDPSIVVMGKEPVLADDRVVGYVTSAGFGYSTGESLAYAYVPLSIAVEERIVQVEYFGVRHTATVVSEPRWDATGTRLRV